jgi:hypothetical protein
MRVAVGELSFTKTNAGPPSPVDRVAEQGESAETATSADGRFSAEIVALAPAAGHWVTPPHFVAAQPTANDTIFGQDGDDHLDGGSGNNVLDGGLGHDICVDNGMTLLVCPNEDH